ncbi:MAG: nickel-responsive transcriptional regulator NikR [Gemmatimonadota bacterium]
MIRFGVSMDEELLERFDHWITRSGQVNRSEAVRDLVRARLIEATTADDDARGLGVLTLVYDHHQRELQDRLTSVQHDYGDLIISTTHVHVSHRSCLEVILLRGSVGAMRQLSDALGGLKGVKHGRLTLTSVEP